MKGKVSKNKFLKVVLPALLVVAIICQAVGFQAVLAKGNVATTSLMTYPNVQQYTKEAGQDFTLAENSRIFVVANEKTLNNTILLKDLKLTSSNFEAAGVLSKAPIIVFGKEENAVVNDIVVRMEDVAELEGKAESYKLDITDKITNGGSTVPRIATNAPRIPASLYPTTMAPLTAIAPGEDCAIATRSSISFSSIQWHSSTNFFFIKVTIT